MDLPLRAALAEAFRLAELDFRRAQQSLATDSSDEARSRYARALANYDRLQAMFQWLAADGEVGEA